MTNYLQMRHEQHLYRVDAYKVTCTKQQAFEHRESKEKQLNAKEINNAQEIQKDVTTSKQ